MLAHQSLYLFLTRFPCLFQILDGRHFLRTSLRIILQRLYRFDQYIDLLLEVCVLREVAALVDHLGKFAAVGVFYFLKLFEMTLLHYLFLFKQLLNCWYKLVLLLCVLFFHLLLHPFYHFWRFLFHFHNHILFKLCALFFKFLGILSFLLFYELHCFLELLNLAG